VYTVYIVTKLTVNQFTFTVKMMIILYSAAYENIAFCADSK